MKSISLMLRWILLKRPIKIKLNPANCKISLDIKETKQYSKDTPEYKLETKYIKLIMKPIKISLIPRVINSLEESCLV